MTELTHTYRRKIRHCCCKQTWRCIRSGCTTVCRSAECMSGSSLDRLQRTTVNNNILYTAYSTSVATQSITMATYSYCQCHRFGYPAASKSRRSSILQAVLVRPRVSVSPLVHAIIEKLLIRNFVT